MNRFDNWIIENGGCEVRNIDELSGMPIDDAKIVPEYLPLLISKLCYCVSLTSLETFDVLDASNIDLELPTIGSIAKKPGNVDNSMVVIHGNATDKTSNSTDSFNSNTTISTEKQNYTKWIFNTNGLFNNSDEKEKQFIDTYKDSTDKSTDIKIQPNNTSASADSNGVLNVNELNSTHLSKNGAFYNTSGTLPAFNFPPPLTSIPCPKESPAIIGTYEVPTQRDVVLHIRNHLLAMYHGFHTKAMNFLKDVQEATQASWSRKMFCRGPTELMLYRRCVRWVGDLSVLTTKSLVTALETARHNIATFMQGKICSISALNIDPIHLIRILAAEKVSLEFALPDFLRQLHACAKHCPSPRLATPPEYLKTSHLTDKDFVVRHYLTQRNYNQQLREKYKF